MINGEDVRGKSATDKVAFRFGLAGLLVVITLIYGQVISFDFVDFDDYQYVTRNPALAQGFTLDAVRWAFTSFYASNWHPLTWLSHLLDIQLFGLHAGGHHLVSLLLHGANALLLATILVRTTGAPWRSLSVAFLFAVHPLHVESVAYVAERKDVLSALFWLLTIEVYRRYSENPGRRVYLLLLVVYALGLMTKPMLVTLPLILLLLDYWPLRRLRPQSIAISEDSPGVPFSRLCLEKIPLLLLAGCSSVVTYLAQQAGGSVATASGKALATQIGNAFISYLTYLAKTAWPMKLAVFYPFDPRTVTAGRVALAALALIGLTWLFLRGARRHPCFVTGWFWYLVSLVPVIGLVRVGEQAMADRYTYLPLVGIFIILVWGGALLTNRYRLGLPLVGCVIGALFVALSVMAWYQVRCWRSSFTLFEHALGVTDNNWLAHHNLATACIDTRQYDRAIRHLHEAIRIRPDYTSAYNNLGNVYVNLGNPALAIDNYRRALSIDDGFVPARRNLVRAYLRYGYRDLAAQEYDLLKEQSPEEAARAWPQ